MNRLFAVPQGQFQLTRLPARKQELLQAFDAADLYLLNDMAQQFPNTDSLAITLVNDSFGALAVALHCHRLTALSDSYLSQQATLRNYQDNGLDSSGLQLRSSLDAPAGAIDVCLIKIPKTLALLEDQLHRLRPFLTAQTVILAAGMVKTMPTSVWTLFERLIGPTQTELAVKKARLIRVTLQADLPLPTNPYPVRYALENTPYWLINHANVFSRDRLDIGSRFLLQHLPIDGGYQRFIDLGCGNGVVGLMLAAQLPQAHISFMDESHMALASARSNFTAAFGHAREAAFVLDNCLDSVASASADCIVCNPPFHQQHTMGDMIADYMFRQAARVLVASGELRVIGNRHLQYHVQLKRYFGRCDTLAGNAKFVIYRCLLPKTSSAINATDSARLP